jgi:hypothetical protein
MLTAHEWLAVAAIATAAVAAGWGGVVYLWRGEPGPALRQALTLVQTLLIAQVGVGLLLVSDGRRAEEDLHYTYGTLALAAALSPWFYAPRGGRARLGWFSGASLLAGALALRAYMTA